MKTEDYYKNAELKKNSKITNELNNSKSSELLKEFIGNEEKYKSLLIKMIIKSNDLTIDKVYEIIENQKLFITVKDYDLFKEFFILEKNIIEKLEKNWLTEFRILGKLFLLEIYFKRNKENEEKSIINQKYQLIFKKCEYLNIQL